tara:strand:- start:354 stop:1529 length:1176 start_codon:yes stop_codon:yes gene_type:complete
MGRLKFKKKINILFVTSSRADYGYLKELIKKIGEDRNFSVKIVVTGSHLNKNFGLTYKEIIKDGIKIFKKIKIKNFADTRYSTIECISKTMKSFGNFFSKTKVDILILVGDRYEIFGVAVAAYTAGIKIAHIGGGEVTEGSFDDSFRHSISKMSYLHFASQNLYKKRLIQLGENPNRIFVTGNLALQNLKNIKILKKKDIEKILKIKFLKKSLLVTLHPETFNYHKRKNIITNLLRVISNLSETTIIFTCPNADPDNKILFRHIKKFIKKNKKNKYFFYSLGQSIYFSCIKNVDVVVGNSSSGINEVPYFKTPTLNIGNRQTGRYFPTSVINVKDNIKDIDKGLKKIFYMKEKLQKKNFYNFYNKKGVRKIVKILKLKYPYKQNLNTFFDL